MIFYISKMFQLLAMWSNNWLFAIHLNNWIIIKCTAVDYSIIKKMIFCCRALHFSANFSDAFGLRNHDGEGYLSAFLPILGFFPKSIWEAASEYDHGKKSKENTILRRTPIFFQMFICLCYKNGQRNWTRAGFKNRIQFLICATFLIHDRHMPCINAWACAL